MGQREKLSRKAATALWPPKGGETVPRDGPYRLSYLGTGDHPLPSCIYWSWMPAAPESRCVRFYHYVKYLGKPFTSWQPGSGENWKKPERGQGAGNRAHLFRPQLQTKTTGDLERGGDFSQDHLQGGGVRIGASCQLQCPHSWRTICILRREFGVHCGLPSAFQSRSPPRPS